MTTESDSAAIARRWYDEALNGRSLDVLDEILADEVVHHAGTLPDVRSVKESKRILRAALAGFPDAQWTVDDVISDDDAVVIRWTASGTHTGEFQGIAPTGNQVAWSGINIFRFECGRIVEIWSEIDGLGRLGQLGVVPASKISAPASATPSALGETWGHEQSRANARNGAFRSGAHDDFVTALGLAAQEASALERLESQAVVLAYLAAQFSTR